MDWQDDAIVLGARALGETGQVVELLTRTHGRHLGLVRGRRSVAALLQPGNTVQAAWRARLNDHLGTYKLEPVRAPLAGLMDDHDALAALRALCAVAMAVLPEREPHGALFEAAEIVIAHLAEKGGWPALYVRWELGLLEELGFGLDLRSCAVTGTRDDLAYVSPRTGRAVSRAAGGEYADKLFRLPQFLQGSQAGAPERKDIRDGLALTGHFILRRILEPHGKALPAPRLSFRERFAAD